ncbi:tRNA-modifying protein YgfZ [Aquicella siphonis]|uniref:tRNA-modifying protein YgfZ n=1 Tax=Aquicella siphonis TaxID=254247 RepID=A0A5E4PI81_9COXI|nr:folate-binding protein YgfZ [Aquicella siphonis]VVC76103.1 tRNA-modifying protein YgfZ [Aquicella siphonis]
MTMLFDLTDSGFIEVSGTDAAKFLQGQLTCDVMQASATAYRMGAHCNPQGRIISLFQLFSHEGTFYLFMPANMISIAIQALKKYAVFFKVALKDAGSGWRAVGLQGELPADLSGTHLLRASLPGQSSRHIIAGERAAISEFLHRHGQSAHGSLEEWKRLAILDGLPSIYPETSGKILPHEINLVELNAISLAKGCYTGQEVIARMHYRGKLKTHLYQAGSNTINLPIPGSDIYRVHHGERRVCGMVIDACKGGPAHPTLVLVSASDKTHPDEQFCLDDDDKSILTILHGSSPHPSTSY